MAHFSAGAAGSAHAKDVALQEAKARIKHRRIVLKRLGLTREEAYKISVYLEQVSGGFGDWTQCPD